MRPTIVTGEWSHLREHAQALRLTVFVVEQGVPIELEWDEADAISLHAVAYDEHGAPVGTGRLLPDGHIGRMAVLRSMRGTGIGSQILHALVNEAERQGHHALVLHAQTHAIAFYKRHGFVVRGEEFMEAGIPHHEMRLTLASRAEHATLGEASKSY
jgi:predicted GNAT family N-acyltransferase